MHGDTQERKKIYELLKHELKIHADAEERHSVAEHHEIDELIEQLEDTEMSASNWLKIAKDLENKLIHHLDEEDHEVFQMAGKALTKKQKISLASDYNKEITKTR